MCIEGGCVRLDVQEGCSVQSIDPVHPERVTALILVSPAAGPDQSLGSRYPWLVKLPQVQRLGPLLVRRIANSGPETIDLAWHNPANQPADTLPLYTKPLKAENWDLALWHFSTAINESLVPDQIGQLKMPRPI